MLVEEAKDGMRVKHLLKFLALLLFAGVLPAMANGIQIQLAPLVPVSPCVPTTGFTCAGPTSVSATVAGIGTVTITAYKPFPGTLAAIAVTLDSNTPSSVPYLGVFGGNNEDEIDLEVPAELLQISFSNPVYVTTINLNKLFLAFKRGDPFTEVAAISFLRGGTLLGTNLYPGTANGLFQANSPFGPVKVDTLQFFAFPTSSSTDAGNSDFGVSSLTASPVPEPGTLALLASGLAALAARRRLRRTNS